MITNIEKAILRRMKRERNMGRFEGRIVGLREGKLEIAERLIAMGLSMQEVVRITGLSEEEVMQRIRTP